MPNQKQKNTQTTETPEKIEKAPLPPPALAKTPEWVGKKSAEELQKQAREVFSTATIIENDGTKASLEKLKAEIPLEQKEQQESAQSLFAAISTVLSTLYLAGWTKEQLKNPALVAEVAGKQIPLLTVEKAGLLKLAELLKTPEAPVTRELLAHWNQYVETHYTWHGAAQEVIKGKEQPLFKKISPEIRKAKGQVLKFIDKHPVLSAGFALAGAYGVYRLIKWMFTSEEKAKEAAEKPEKKESTFWKWLKRGLLSAFGVFLIGRILGTEKVQNWIKDALNIDISKNRISQAVVYLSKGEFKKAWDILMEGTENFEVYRTIADKIGKEMGQNIDPKVIKTIGNAKYKKYISMQGEATSMVKTWLSDLAHEIPGSQLLGFAGKDEVEQEKTVREYLKKHEKEIEALSPTADTTVLEILAKLTGSEQLLREAKIERTELEETFDLIQKNIENIKDPEKKAVSGEILNKLREKMVSLKDTEEIISRAKKREIPVQRLEKLLEDEKQALKEFEELTTTETAASNDIADKGMQIAMLNDAIAQENYKIVEELKKRPGWEELKYLAVVQGVMMGRRYLIAPDLYKAYGKYKGLQLVKKPFEIVSSQIHDIYSSLRPSPEDFDALKQAAENNIKSIDYEYNDLDQKIKAGTATNDEKMRFQELDVEKKIFESERNIAGGKKTIKDQVQKIADMKSGKITAQPHEIDIEEKLLKSMQGNLDNLQTEKIILENQRLEKKLLRTRLMFEKDIDLSKGRTFTADHFRELDNLEKSVAQNRQVIEDQLVKKAMLLRDAKAGKMVGANVTALEHDINRLMGELSRLEFIVTTQFQRSANFIVRGWKKYKAMFRGEDIDNIYRGELATLRKWYLSTIPAHKKTAKTAPLFGKIKTVKGALLFYTPILIGGTLLQRDTETSLAEAAGQTAIDMAPLTGTFSDAYSLFTGEEIVTGRKLDWTDRGIRGLFAAAGAVTDIASLAGIGLAGRAGLTGLRAAKGVKTAARVEKEVEALRSGKTLIEEMKGYKMAKSVGKWSGRLAIGGILGQLGYQLIFQPSTPVEITPEMREVLGDSLEEVPE